MKDGETRIYTVPLRRGFAHKPVWKRTNAAVRTLRNFIKRHTKMEPKLLSELNEFLWSRGNKKPPARVKIKVLVKGGFAYVNLENKEIVLPEKKEEKKEKKEEKKEEKEKPTTKDKTKGTKVPKKQVRRRIVPKRA